MRPLLVLLISLLFSGCAEDRRVLEDPDGDIDGDVATDGDADGDSDGDSDSDSDADGDGDSDGDGDGDADGDGDGDCTELWCVEEWVTLHTRDLAFEIGSPSHQPGHEDDETRHRVFLTFSFEIQTTEVTQYQFERRMGYDPTTEEHCDRSCPVGSVSWNEAVAYCNVLSDEEGVERCYSCTGTAPDVSCSVSAAVGRIVDCEGFRLPTEAEWEAAARGGNHEQSTYNGTLTEEQLGCDSPNAVLDTIAWFCGNSERTVQPVAQLAPNDYGLYDMLGNRLEAAHDWYAPFTAEDVTDPMGPETGSQRVYRGGYAWDEGRGSRAASRYRHAQDSDRNLGFRPARTIP